METPEVRTLSHAEEEEKQQERELSTLVSKGLEFAQQLTTCRQDVGEAGLPIAEWMSKIEARFGGSEETTTDLANRLIDLVEQTATIESMFDDGYQYNLKVTDIRQARKNKKSLKEATDQVSDLSAQVADDKTDYEEAAFLIAGPLTNVLDRIFPNASDEVIAAMVLWYRTNILIILANVVGLPPIYFLQIFFIQSPALSLFLTFLTSLGGFSIAWTMWLVTMNVWCEIRPDSPSCPRNWLDNGDDEEEEEEKAMNRGYVLRNGERIVTDLLRCIFEQAATTIIPALLDLPIQEDP